MHYKLALLCVVAAATIRVAHPAASSVIQEDEDITFEDDAYSSRTKRDTADVLPVAAPLQDEEESFPSPTESESSLALERAKRQGWFWGTPSDDEDQPEGSTDIDVDDLEGSGVGLDRKWYLRINLHVLRTYSSQYADRNSRTFQEFASSFSQAVTTLLQPSTLRTLSGIQSVRVSRVRRSASQQLEVLLDINYSGPSNPKPEIERILRDAFRTGSIGSLRVDARNFRIDVSEEPPQPIDTCRGDDQLTCVDNVTIVCEVQRCDGVNDCPDGDDEAGCMCPPNEFVCDTVRCIPKEKLCDGRQDCADNTDEAICPTIPICRSDSQGPYLCSDGVTSSCHCDGITECPDGDDESSARCGSGCAPGEFECDSGSKCVPLAKMCDSFRDCVDGTDERSCPDVCRSDQFKCNDGRCIDNFRRCDYIADCAGSEDEAQCPCVPPKYECNSGMCINPEERCDGKWDCDDGSDELIGCPCRGDQFTCRDGLCVDQILRCDGMPDCLDFSDEKNCPACVDDAFHCGDNQCIPTDNVCDGVQDCDTDEQACDCEGSGQLQCDGGEVCLTDSQICDGVQDCRDGTDEPVGCMIKACSDNEFECNDQSCVPLSQRCDGIEQCPDRSDEADCPTAACSQYEWQCRDGTCIPEQYKCDLIPQCIDRSDEENCPSEPTDGCNIDEWQCNDSSCVALSLRCDGRSYDCPDYSDEIDCPQVCVSGEWQCQDGTCIYADQRCDGTYQCFDYSDEANCPLGCGPGMWQCRNGQCIPDRERCDSTPHCLDRSDEENCTDVDGCGDGAWQCRDGSRCISEQSRCDGRYDCPDYSDEDGCPGCGSGEWMCRNGQCVMNSERCDNIAHCFDGSDEIDCQAATCSPYEWQCRDGTCIPEQYRCDLIPHCIDRSDEENCPSEPTDGCGVGAWQCRDRSRCISEQSRCDGRYDCPDYSDEEGCTDCRYGEWQCRNRQCIPSSEYCDRIAQCSDGSDEDNCPEDCSVGYWQCRDRVTCIPEQDLCNGFYDCPDYSDEDAVNCQGCRDGEWRCNSGECVLSSDRCNGITQCSDQSDEINCPGCGAGAWQCLDRSRCIPEQSRCDGRFDCTDGSDEDCGGCRPDEWQCRDSSCIPAQQRCDQVPNCIDRSDEDNCPVGCGPEEFACRDDGTCIPAYLRCDGRPYCRDSSDEWDCGPDQPSCDMTIQWQCDYAECIDLSLKCNGKVDCPEDDSDERNCPSCRPDQFQCSDGLCIPSTSRCNGGRDCRDGSDEQGCPCSTDEWQCQDGRCIPSLYRCDGRQDCVDNSDEIVGCPCRSSDFTCRDGSCISGNLRCNGYGDCADGSDEVECRFSCRNGQVIDSIKECDGRPDCADGSDEHSDCRPTDPPITPGGGDRLNLKTYPATQTIHESREVVFQCRDEGPQRSAVRWSRAGGAQLPPGSTDNRGRLTMPNIQIQHAGRYYCEAQGVPANTAGRSVEVYLEVTRLVRPTQPPTVECRVNEATCMNGECVAKTAVCNGVYDCSDGSDEMRCNPLGCEPNEFQCNNKRCVLKTWLCDSDDDCGDNSDEEKCATNSPDDTCRYNEFTCQSANQCIPKSFHCDGETDCQDDSDEIGCSKPQVIEPPCRETKATIGSTFVIECRAVGMPTPTVNWRLNWGHVPDTCTMTSVDGAGVLTCPNAQVHHQGAYSCEVINSLGSVFAQPDCIVSVTGGPEVCSPPQFNAEASRDSDCLSCFCFGTSSSPVCHSTEMYISQIPPPRNEDFELVGVNLNQRQGNFEIRDAQYPIRSTFIRSKTPVSVQLNVRDRTSLGGPNDLIIFFSLPESHKGSQLKSYGGYLRYTIEYQSFGSGQPMKGPDVVIRGNGVTLMHIHEETFRPNQRNQVDVRFWPGEWYKRVTGRGRQVQPQEPATREDIMMVLQNMDMLLIRALYEDSQYIDVTLSEVKLDTATFRDDRQGRAVFVESCQCPPGYAGDSCEKCAPNYKRVETGTWLGQCVIDVECGPKEYGDPANGIPCMPCPCPLTNPSNQFGSCYLDTAGQVTCNCPTGYTGRRCQSCAAGYEGNPNVVGGTCKPVIPECEWYEFICRDMTQCLHKDLRCNGYRDCADGSDEEHCPLAPICSLNFMCDDGKIQKWNRRCDGIYDCIGHEDEKDCPVCVNDGHLCGDRHCINYQRICDKVYDCDDRTDELINNQQCTQRRERSCSDDGSEWTCADHSCIPWGFYCDGKKDCQDGSDEIFCGCNCEEPFGFMCNDLTCIRGELRCNGINDCRDGSDELRCSGVCDPSSEHQCVGDGRCIPLYQKCDGNYDCSDRSDEPPGCSTSNKCNPDYQFQCRDGGCVYLQQRCNGIVECADSSDERNCCNPSLQHQCRDGTCINLDQVCNGRWDCEDGSDEPPSCAPQCNPSYQYQCNDGSCLDLSQRCDGSRDCPDWGDEMNCECGPPWFFECADRTCIYAEEKCDGNVNCPDGSDESVYTCTGECNPIGSNSARLDPRTGQCDCKKLTTGPKCDTCKRGSFYMNENNQFGCISCFCMGVTNQCRSSSYYREQEMSTFSNSVQGFKLVSQYQQTVFSEISEPRIFADSGRKQLVFTDNQNNGRTLGGQEAYYWRLPQKYLGDKVTSYGGNLTYTLRFEASQGGQMSRNNAHDVEIYGNDVLLRHSISGVAGLRGGVEETISVPFYEQYWKRQDNNQANREHLLMALADLEYILVKATYTTYTQEVGLKEVQLDYAEERNSGQERAFAVEVCDCPEGHTGLSCEDCSPGYTRGLSGQYLGRCVRCECNGHSEDCHPEEGVCQNCRDNTGGDFCDECLPGFSGNPRNGGRCQRTDGPCSCSLRGSVSEQCNRDDTCSCKANVEGDNCDRCRPGYFHMSELNEEGCLKCWCNGATTQCFSTSYNRTQLPMQLFDNHGFTITNRMRTKTIQEQELRVDLEQNRLTFSGFNQLRDSQTYYWSLPPMFTGNRLTSYGGNLTVTQQFDAQRSGTQFADADVILKSSKGREFIWMNPDRLRAGQPKSYSVFLTEKSFTVNQQPASRSEFMEALASIEVILIRSTMSAGMRSAYIQELTMDTGVSQPTGQRQAVEVEQCRCPKEYTGLSCEQCKTGYYHDGSACRRCPCNGREESCQIDQNDKVLCNCIQGWFGLDCGQTGLMLELRPSLVVLHRGEVDHRINLRCSYKSSERLKIRFVHGPQYQTPGALMMFDRASLQKPVFYPHGAEQDIILHLNPGDRFIKCQIIDENNLIVGEAITKIVELTSTRQARPPQPDRPVDKPVVTEPLITVTAGQTATFRCRGRTSGSQSQTSISWSREDNVVLPYGRTRNFLQDRDAILIISQTEVSDSGRYVCTVTDGFQFEQEIATLVVAESVRVTISEPTLTVTIGQTATFGCSGRGSTGRRDDVQSVSWRKADGTSIPSGKYRIRQEGVQTVLVIPQVTRNDEGSYICIVTDSSGSSEKTATLYVSGGRPDRPRVLIQEGQRVQYSEGQRGVRISCSAEGFARAPTITWSRERNEPLPRTATQEDGQLVFSYLTEADSGTYTCTGTSSGGQVTATITIAVRRVGGPRPELQPQPQPPTGGELITVTTSKPEYQPGDTIRLTCSAQLITPVTLTWTRMEGALPSRASQADGVLTMVNVQPADSGVYICRMVRSEGRIDETSTRVIIRQIVNLPEVSIQPDRQTINQGTSAELRCVATGVPAPRVTWSKVNEDFGPAVRADGNVLRITNAAVSDRGMYVCTAESGSGGTAQAAAIVEVERREPPVIDIYPEIRQTIVSGASALFQCHLTAGIPSPTVTWARTNGRPLTPNTETLSGGVLRFNQVRGEEEGSYVCTATNDAGTTTATATLEIQSLPIITLRSGPSPYRVQVGSRLALECSASGDPQPTVSWKKLQVGLPTTIGSRSSTPTTAIYEITSATRADEGTYQCTARNAAGVSEERIQVQVTENQLPVRRPTYTQSNVSPGTRPRPDSSDVVRAPLGGSFQFRCRSDPGDPSIRFDFRRSDSRPLPDEHTIANGVLSISNIGPEASGEYACVGLERATGSVLFTIYSVLQVSAPPQIRLEPARQVVRPGDTVRLTCSATGDQPITINWSKEQGYMPTSVVINGGELTFRGIETTDAGRYNCEAINSAGTARAMAEVVVNGSNGIGYTEDVFFDDEDLLERGSTPEEGYYMEVAATATCTPDQFVCKDGSGCVDMTNRCNYKRDCPDGSDEILCFLHDENIMDYDSCSDFFRCGDGTCYKYYLNCDGHCDCEDDCKDEKVCFRRKRHIVNEEPLLTAMQPNPVFYAGQNQELRCEVSGIDPNTVTWTRQGSRLPLNAFPRGNVLRLSNVKVEDGGRYVCSARTTQGLVQSDVINLTIERQQSVDIRIQQDRDRVSTGGDLTLSCYVGGSTKSSVQWSRQGARLPYNVQARGRDLVFNNILPENGGIYMCSVTTPQGVFEKAYPLTIQTVVIPGNIVDNGNTQRSVQTRSAPFGTSVMMKCGISLTPPVSYTWVKKNSEMPLDARVKDEILELPDVHSEDAGTYICTTRNAQNAMDMPTLLIVTGVVPRFDDKSYLTLPTLEHAYLVFDMEISFKPEIDTGLILYNSQQKNSVGDFVAFGLKGGYAEFSFNVGSGPTFVMSKEPLELNKWHTVKLSRNRKDGTMIVNGGRPVTEHSEGRFQGLDLIEDLYVGGVEDYSQIQRQAGFMNGFKGCISRFVIGNAIVELLSEAKQKVGVTSCNSCSDNPCDNSGVCQESYSTYGFKCICPTGFSGDRCENIGLGCYPGICGTGRCINKPGGFECFCPYGKIGERCEQDIIIYEPAFGSESYIAYPTPRALRRFSLDLDFKPENLNDGVLMYCAQKESGEGDFTSLALRNKKIEFKFNTGTGTAMLTSDELQPGQWVKVRANRTDRLGSMQVNGGDLQNEESPGLSRGLNLRTPLYIGGVDNQKISMNPDVAVEGGFTGCIRQIRLMDAEVPLAESLVDSANVGQCGGSGISACASNPCVNNGVCENNPSVPHGYSCTCEMGYSGLNCNVEPGVCSLIQPCENGGVCVGSGESYSCRCPLGFAGRHCSHSTEVKESTSYDGDSWIEFDKNLLPQDSEASQEVEIEFSTLESNGVLFWLGQQETVSGQGQDYLSVALVDGRIQFSYELGTGEVKILSSITSNDGERHRLKIKRSGKDGVLEIDNNVKKTGRSQGILHMLNANGNIYVGGLPNVRLMTGNVHENGFKGCIHQLRIGNQKLEDIREFAVSGINVTPCPRSDERYSRGSSHSSHRAGRGHNGTGRGHNGTKQSHRTHSSGHSSSQHHPSDTHESNSETQKHFKNGTHYRTESKWSSKKTVLSRHNFKQG